MFDIMIQIGQNFAALFSLIFIFSFFSSYILKNKSTLQPIVVGFLFSAAAIFGMLNPVRVTEGVIIDARVVLVALAGTFGGPIAGAVAVLVIAGYRIYLGGIGTVAGVMVIIFAGVIGSFFSWEKIKNKETHYSFWILGVLLAIVGLSATFLLPRESLVPVLNNSFFPVIISYPVATFLFGTVFGFQIMKNDTAQKLLESETQFRLLAENSTDIISRHTPEGVYLYVSPACYKLLGYQPDELIGRSVFEMIHPDDIPILTKTRNEMIEKLALSTTRFRSRHKNGNFIWLESTSHAVWDKKTKGILEIQATTRVIAERKQVEDALRLSEERFMAIASNTPDHIIMHDRKLRYLLVVNPQLGLTQEDMLGKTDYDILSKEDADELTLVKQRVLETGEVVHLETSLTSKMGGIEHFDGTYVPTYDTNKQITGLIGYFRNITERELAKQALQESEEKFRDLFENMNDGFALHKIILDENGKPMDYEFIEANPIFLKRIGMKAEDLINHTALELFPKTEQAWIDTFGQVALSGEPMHFTNYSVEMNKYYETRLYCPRPGYFAGLFADITEQKLIEIEREKLIEELSAKNAELERFTYTVSHDLKSPIVTIRGFLGYLEQDARKGDILNLEKDIQRITDATEKMRDLLNDLLELSRIGRMMNTPENISFKDLLNDALDAIHGQVEQSQVMIQTQPDFPVVYGDRQRLVEVLQNLLENAVKYMGDQPEPYIEIGQQGDEDGNPVFYVKDNGIGISPKYHELIFGLFNKLDAKSEGTGIGLALVKRIVEVHGGRIWVESEPGKGTTFFFSLQADRNS